MRYPKKIIWTLVQKPDFFLPVAGLYLLIPFTVTNAESWIALFWFEFDITADIKIKPVKAFP